MTNFQPEGTADRAEDGANQLDYDFVKEQLGSDEFPSV